MHILLSGIIVGSLGIVSIAALIGLFYYLGKFWLFIDDNVIKIKIFPIINSSVTADIFFTGIVGTLILLLELATITLDGLGIATLLDHICNLQLLPTNFWG